MAGCASTGMRMALLVCIVEIISFLFITNRITTGMLKKIGIMLVIVFGAYVLFLKDSFIVENLVTRIGALSSGDNSFSVRFNTYFYIFEQYITSNFFYILFGHGLGSISNISSTETILGSGHNFVISSLYEFGFIGLMLVIVLYWAIFEQLWKYRSDYLCKALIGGIMGYLFTALTNDSYILNGDLFHCMYIVICLSYITNKREHKLILQ